MYERPAPVGDVQRLDDLDVGVRAGAEERVDEPRLLRVGVGDDDAARAAGVTQASDQLLGDEVGG